MLILCEYDFEPFPHKVQVNYAVICAEKAKKKKKIGKNPHSAEKHMKKHEQHSKFFQELEVGMGFSWIWIQFGIGISWTESRGNNKINKN